MMMLKWCMVMCGFGVVGEVVVCYILWWCGFLFLVCCGIDVWIGKMGCLI